MGRQIDRNRLASRLFPSVAVPAAILRATLAAILPVLWLTACHSPQAPGANQNDPTPQNTTLSPGQPVTPETSPRQNPEVLPGPIVGGYGDAAETVPDLAKAKSLALKALAAKFPSDQPIDAVRSQIQVVAGLNYKFEILRHGTPGERFEVVVYRDLQNHFSVTSVTRKPASKD